MTAHTDTELSDWIFGIVDRQPFPAGDFLRELIHAVCRADDSNYEILRPALLSLKAKYPQYGRSPASAKPK